MENLGGKLPMGSEEAFGRVLNRDLFLFLLDLEVKRARRYQNFLCLMLLKIKQYSQEEEGDGGGLQACHQILGNLLMEEIRESDIIGSLKLDKLAVLLPYADVKAGDHVKSRFEDALKYYDFKSKRVEVMIDQVCFPINGTDTTDLIKRALAEEPS